ncbi:MAG TPA: 16S rRNA (guanine(966)-N(2))-methyltransferase RsmD [Candidatus Acidoferrales bacterium]|nr:16S rRNA (guanine(966)-N(2))-methyltransferase RsmD [Candidatus Acidoferrales bacterium]
MRVIAGKYGSRRIASGRGMELRPTSDRLRETLFDILQDRVAGSFFVDGYAGTGAVGIEAASRGARRVVFLEKHRPTAALLRKNLESLGIHEGVEVMAGDLVRGLAELAKRGAAADIMFFDPPYAEAEEYTRVLEALEGSALVGPETLLIFERAGKMRMEAECGRLVRTRTVTQGDAALEFFKTS